MRSKMLASLLVSFFVLTAFFSIKTASACACGGPDPMYMTNYKFYYPGTIKLDYKEGQDVAVMKKIKNLNNQQPELLKLVKDGIFDKAKLTNLNLQNINFTEDKDYGYSIYIDFLESNISFSENYERWQRDYNVEFPYTIKNYPANDEIIKISDQFTKDYGLSLKNFGKPFVQENIQKMYKESTDKANFYVPEMVTVIYPMLLNGKEVYDESGYQNGLNITVDLRLKKVSNVWNLSFANYENTTLKAEADLTVLKKMIQDGGTYPMYYGDPKVKSKTMTLQAPKEIYLRTYKYDGMKSDEMYVPALLFPIQNAEKETMLYKQNVVIPLVRINSTFETTASTPPTNTTEAITVKEVIKN